MGLSKDIHEDCPQRGENDDNNNKKRFISWSIFFFFLVKLAAGTCGRELRTRSSAVQADSFARLLGAEEVQPLPSFTPRLQAWM